jgi:hypothetical protein
MKAPIAQATAEAAFAQGFGLYLFLLGPRNRKKNILKTPVFRLGPGLVILSSQASLAVGLVIPWPR